MTCRSSPVQPLESFEYLERRQIRRRVCRRPPALKIASHALRLAYGNLTWVHEQTTAPIGMHGLMQADMFAIACLI